MTTSSYMPVNSQRPITDKLSGKHNLIFDGRSKRRLILNGQRFGRLLVLEKAPDIGRYTAWHCICDCGTHKNIKTSLLTNHGKNSCGCLQKETARRRNLTHGLSKTPEYSIWGLMRDRCYNKNNPRFEDYGGRGITVCESWNDFTNFLRDMGPRPSGLTLDRINTAGNYEPSNCRWATWKEQANSRRRRGTGSLARKAMARKAAASL